MYMHDDCDQMCKNRPLAFCTVLVESGFRNKHDVRYSMVSYMYLAVTLVSPLCEDFLSRSSTPAMLQMICRSVL